MLEEVRFAARSITKRKCKAFLGSFRFQCSLFFLARAKYLCRCVAIGDEGVRETLYSWLILDYRYVETLFRSNFVRTAHYHWWSFIFVNTFDQFRRATNFYFLTALILSFVLPDVPVDPLVRLYGLLFIIAVTMVKQGCEDYRRHVRDKKANERKVKVVKGGELHTIQCKDIKVGDVVCLEDGDMVPCDCVILSTHHPEIPAFISTSNLDGETNLKSKLPTRLTKELTTLSQILEFEGFIECENPNPVLHTFVAKLFQINLLEKRYEMCAIGPDSLVLMGSQVKRTKFIFASCVYSGNDTKIAMNTKIKRHKFSVVEHSMNNYFFIFFSIMTVETLLSATLAILYSHDYFGREEFVVNKDGSATFKSEIEGRLHWYLVNEQFSKLIRKRDVKNLPYLIAIFFVIYSYLLPISLYCSIEIQKVLSSWLFSWDKAMHDQERAIAPKCNNSDVAEDLGLITHIFTDKTGTLTENEMVLKHYCLTDGNIKDVTGLATEPYSAFLQTILLCHTVEINPEDGSFVATSADEEALVDAAKENGLELVENSLEGNLVIKHKEKLYEYKRLKELTFDSYRKCMSVIIKDLSSGELFVFSKGAESTVFANATEEQDFSRIAGAVERLSERGLRTLVYGYKKLPNKLYNEFMASLQKAELSQMNIQDVYKSLETNFKILGATGIEDKLQEEVYETIDSLREAGLNMWLLTGDKSETALTIAKSAGLVRHPYNLINLCKLSITDLQLKIETTLDLMKQGLEKDYILLIDGQAIEHLMKSDLWKEKLYFLGDQFQTVIASRLSPIQKSQIVYVMKVYDSKNVTLAIGDGGNDVSMLQEAHIGIGIVGREGTAASRSGDFSFAKFKFLKRAILVHGHWFYTRLAYLLQYSFYKCVVAYNCQFWNSFPTNYSGSNVYDTFFLIFFNLLFATLPILVYGATEQVYPAKILLSYPSLFSRNRNNTMLQIIPAMVWLLDGLYHSLVIFIGTYLMWSYFESFGLDKSAFGFSLASTVLLVISLKIFMDARNWNIYFLLALIVSLVAFILITLTYTELGKTSTDFSYKSYSTLISHLGIWLVTPLLTVVALLPNLVYRVLENNAEMEVMKNLSADARLSSRKNG